MNEETLCTPFSPDASHIKEMISLISTTTDGEPLRDHMDRLKKALKENPAACELLQPEDIGEMVRGIMKLENKMILDAKTRSEVKASRKKNGSAKVSLNPDDLNAVADEM